MKEARASRRSNGVRVAREENTSQHIIACQGAAVKGEYTPGGCLGVGEDRVGQGVRAQRRQRRGTRGEMSANEQKQMRETREGSSISYV